MSDNDEKKLSLIDISGKISFILEGIMESGGEITDDTFSELEEFRGKLEVKAGSIAYIIKNVMEARINRLKDLEKARQEADIAARIYELRQQANLSQKQLAEVVGTTQSVISRLEDADYHGHSLEMLRRIATALHCRLQVKIVPQNKHAYA